jgi:hypothetical protein
MRDNERSYGTPSIGGPAFGKSYFTPVWVLTNALPSDKVARSAQVENLTIGAEPEHLDDDL